MKKLVMLSMLIVPYVCFSQQKDTINTPKVKSTLYVGVGGQLQEGLNINKKLTSQNLPGISSTIPELTVGLNIFGKKYSGDMEFVLSTDNPEKNNTELRLMNMTGKFRLHYNIVNKEKIAFTTGLNLALTATELDIYSKSNTIDLNDLEPNNNSGHISLRNQMFYAGPSVALYLFKNKHWIVRLNAGYEFALTRGRWKSDFGSVLNTVNESGNNRFVFGITIL
jgi:hypothetical protein